MINPRPPEQTIAIAARNADFLAELRLQAIEALASGDWDEFYQFLNVARGVTNPPRLRRVSLTEFLGMHSCTMTQTTNVEASADELDSPSADPSQPTNVNQSI